MQQKETVNKRAGSGSSNSANNLPLPAVLFDLDGTLIDSAYHHVFAWSQALQSADISIPNWKIHRRIGMSGESFLRELLRELSPNKRDFDIKRLEEKHDAAFVRMLPGLQPLPGASELLAHLSRKRIRVALATTGNRKQTLALVKKLKLPKGLAIVTGDDVEKAKPSPDIFVAASQRLDVAIDDCIVVGDSVWDLLAAGRKSALGVGLMSGGCGQEELERAGAFRVYSDPADLLQHIEQLGMPGK
jgi:HAD superfamily hydrolase (TIGR01509 family)